MFVEIDEDPSTGFADQRNTVGVTTTSVDGVRARDLTRLLGSDVLAVVAAPKRGGDAPIRTIGLLDDTSERCDLVLLIGPAGSDLPARIAAAAAHGARVVVTDAVPDDVVKAVHGAAVGAGVHVLERVSDVPWLVLSDLIRDAVRHAEADDIRASGVTVADLPGLAESLAEMLGGPVIIEDAKFRVLSYSSSIEHVDRGRDIAILGRRIPDDWLRHLESLGVIDTLLSTDEVVVVENGPFAARRRLLCSIRAERFLLGILWLAEGDTPLPADVRERMVAAARTAAPLLLRHQESTFSRQPALDRQLHHLLDDGTIPHSAAEEYGLSPAAMYTVAALRISPDALLTNIDRNRIVDSVGMYCQSYRRRSATTSIGHTVYCVLAHDDPVSEGRVGEFAATLGAHVGKLMPGRGVHVALSRPAQRLQAVAALRTQVDQVLETAFTPTGSVSVVSFDDALPQIIMAMVDDFVVASAVDHPKLERLRAEDASAGSDFTASLATYLAVSRDVVAAAKRLNIHVSTMRYRLKRIVAISGLDLDDPAERLACELLLRVNAR